MLCPGADCVSVGDLGCAQVGPVGGPICVCVFVLRVHVFVIRSICMCLC